jgi:hypothetical protein
MSVIKKITDGIKLKMTDLEFANENAMVGGSHDLLKGAIK